MALSGRTPGNTAIRSTALCSAEGKGGTFPLVPGSNFPTVSVGSSSNAGCLKGHLFNPAPRIGFAFDPKGDGKMAIRGGYGIFFEQYQRQRGNTSRSKVPHRLFFLRLSPTSLWDSRMPRRAEWRATHASVANGGAIPFFPLTRRFDSEQGHLALRSDSGI